MPKLWYQPRRSGEQLQAVPWLAPKVIQHLENLIQPDWEVIEHGSGGSTLWFAERCSSVTAFEHDPDWQAIVKRQAPENVNVVSGSTATKLQTITVEMLTGFDLCLIDGEPVGDRAKWLKAAPTLVKPGGWVVLDNANRPEYEAERKHMQAYADHVETIDANEGGTMFLVTEFYRMPL
jgi:predicted O-methyltransferase YrrM